MFRVLNCLADQHDWRLVALAGAVCFFAKPCRHSHFSSSGPRRQARTRMIWIAIAGGAIGYGIWATHFIAMLAYDPGIVTGYGVALTAMSLAAAMILTSTGIRIRGNPITRDGARRSAAPLWAPGSPACTISACGRSKPPVAYRGRSTWCWAPSPSASCLAPRRSQVAVRSAGIRATLLAALVADACDCLTPFYCDGSRGIRSGSDARTQQPGAVAQSAGCGDRRRRPVGPWNELIGVLADRRLANRTSKFQKIIQELSATRAAGRDISTGAAGSRRSGLDMAVNNMSQGLVLFDAAERIVVCNRRYIELYGLSPDVAKPGCTFRDLIGIVRNSHLHRQSRAVSFDPEARLAAAKDHPHPRSICRTDVRSRSPTSRLPMAAGSPPIATPPSSGGSKPRLRTWRTTTC